MLEVEKESGVKEFLLKVFEILMVLDEIFKVGKVFELI